LLSLEQGKNRVPAIRMDGAAFTLVPQTMSEQWNLQASVNDLMIHYFIRHLQETRLSRRRQQLLLLLGQQLKKWQRREKELIPIADAEIVQWQAMGDRLLAARSAKEVQGENPNKGVITLPDYETSAPVNIEVDPSHSWVDNAQMYYRRAKKAKAR